MAQNMIEICFLCFPERDGGNASFIHIPYLSYVHVQVEVPAKMAGTIIGPKGQNFRRIEAKTGAMKLKLVPGPNEVLYDFM